MRLIDADKLPVHKAFCIDESGSGATFYVVDKSDIDNAPTAYDVDKVVEQLREASEEYEKRYNKHMEDEDLGSWEAYEDAIKIVRKGGVSDG